ncbi:MAG TPA: LysM peptidoglycan-binding domain-containing protein [Clostridia bacterium]|nr:LysM peptidoglycan-binding domain-containing protein [Clostridia bacterium]
MKRYIIKSKIRFLISVSIIMIIAVSSVFTLAVSAKGSSEAALTAEYVEEGDTIWSLSTNYAGDMDIREYISKVMDINDLQSANIKPGDLLYFPVYN